jgi:signal transduction histidine kinase
VLAVFAARADSSVAHANAWVTALDIAVGLAFVAAASSAPGPIAVRGLVALVGVAWLAGSLWSVARPWHEAALVVALTAFPAGRVQHVTRWALLALAAIVALGLATQPVVAAVFAAVAVSASLQRPRSSAHFPTSAGAALAAVVGLEWLVAHEGTLDPTLALVVYEVVLLAVAVGFPFASRAVILARSALADQLLAEPRVPALEGLGAILGHALGDASLQIYRWQGSGYVDGRGQRVAGPTGNGRWLDVADTTGPVAAVAHHSAALQDRPTIEAVSAAVRLAVTHIRLLEEQQTRLRELEAARARIVAAVDSQRQQVAAELRKDVEPALQGARAELHAALGPLTQAPLTPPAVTSTLVAVGHELAEASALIAGLVAGVPPAHLGGGRLSAALTALAANSPIPVTVSVADGTVADQGAETVAFYVCSEALANAIKHSHATTVRVKVRRADDSIIATVADDGCGGADPRGSGLQGLADRVATRGGRLRVESPPGAGTTVTATVPG